MTKAVRIVAVRFDEEEFLALENFRKNQPIIPSWSDSIRYLVMKATAAELKKKKPNG